MRRRTQAREIALQALYQHDLRRKSDPTVSGSVSDFEGFIQDSSPDAEVRSYARMLLDGTLVRIEELDAKIAAAAQNWRLERIAPVDRCVLRLALLELIEGVEVPPKVAIDEAIELARKYSTAESGSFVNGILDRLYRDLRKGPETEPKASGSGGTDDV
jgi:transcription antitermination factor NusB